MTRSWPLLMVMSALLLGGCTPPGPRALLDGERLLKENQPAAAGERLRVATELLPKNPQAWNHLGLALHRDQQPREAAAAYRKALELDESLAVTRFNLGCLLLEQGQTPFAVRELTSYTLQRPQELDGWIQLGNAGARARQWDVAERAFANAARLNPKHPAVLNGIGLTQLQRRKPNEAGASFQAALQQQNDFAPALLNLAVLTHQYSTNRAGALKLYREYAALNPAGSTSVAPAMQRLEAELAAARTPAPVAPSIVVTNPPPPTIRTAAPPVVGSTPPKPAPATNQAPTNAVAKAKPPAPKPESIAVTPLPPVPTPTPPPTPSPAPAPVPKPAVVVTPEPPPPTPKPSPAPASVTVEKPENNPPTVATTPKVEEEKSGFLQRMNPANLFKNRPKPATPLPSAAANPKALAPKTNQVAKLEPPPAPVETNRPAPIIPPRPPIQRYTYASPARPVAGNRPEAQVQFAKGLEAHRTGRPSLATESYREAVRIDPAFFEAQYNLGLAAYEAGDLPLSLRAYEFALAINRDSANARYNFALALQRGAYYRDAATELDRLLAAHPRETRAHLTLANLSAQQLYDFPAAREHYRKVLELEPQHPQAVAIRYWLNTHP